jgi:hypothetical protein
MGDCFYVRQFSEIYRSCPNFWAAFFTVKVKITTILTKNGLGYILGDFFTNSSGHPGWFVGRRDTSVTDYHWQNQSCDHNVGTYTIVAISYSVLQSR